MNSVMRAKTHRITREGRRHHCIDNYILYGVIIGISSGGVSKAQVTGKIKLLVPGYIKAVIYEILDIAIIICYFGVVIIC